MSERAKSQQNVRNFMQKDAVIEWLHAVAGYVFADALDCVNQSRADAGKRPLSHMNGPMIRGFVSDQVFGCHDAKHCHHLQSADVEVAKAWASMSDSEQGKMIDKAFPKSYTIG